MLDCWKPLTIHYAQLTIKTIVHFFIIKSRPIFSTKVWVIIIFTTLKTARLCDVAMARVLVSVTTNGYQIKEWDLLYPLVPCPLKFGQGFTSGGPSKSSSFQSCKDNLWTDLMWNSVQRTQKISILSLRTVDCMAEPSRLWIGAKAISSTGVIGLPQNDFSRFNPLSNLKRSAIQSWHVNDGFEIL